MDEAATVNIPRALTLPLQIPRARHTSHRRQAPAPSPSCNRNKGNQQKRRSILPLGLAPVCFVLIHVHCSLAVAPQCASRCDRVQNTARACDHGHRGVARAFCDDILNPHRVPPPLSPPPLPPRESPVWLPSLGKSVVFAELPTPTASGSDIEAHTHTHTHICSYVPVHPPLSLTAHVSLSYATHC